MEIRHHRLRRLDTPHPWLTISGELALSASVLSWATGLAITLGGRDVAAVAFEPG